MTAGACQLQQGCEFPPSARVTLSRHPAGPVYLTVVPIQWATGGIPGCADHVHSHIDGLLMGASGPASPPAVEQTPGGAP